MSYITAKELANMLDNMQYNEDIPRAINNLAADNNLLIVLAYRDSIALRGAFGMDFNCALNKAIKLDINKEYTAVIKLVRNADTASYRIAANVPCEKFKRYDGGFLACECAVIDIMRIVKRSDMPEIVYRAKGEGKTAQLIKQSEQESIPILVGSKNRLDNLKRFAQCIGAQIPEPLTVSDYMQHRIPNRPHRLLIDDVDNVIAHIFSGTDIKTMTLRKTQQMDDVLYPMVNGQKEIEITVDPYNGIQKFSADAAESFQNAVEQAQSLPTAVLLQAATQIAARGVQNQNNEKQHKDTYAKAMEIIEALNKLGTPHNFQHIKDHPWIISYCYGISTIIKKAIELKKEIEDESN